ncbi:DEAD/DEAH box helicase [Halomonas venusta]|uniref:DEAD/DEAH box helicase n=1 Tax=Vreelandella venusta TaxID=44935 RepID=UPI00295F0744|nr:DEAD/DEAH box helicase [Halomonas venusta]MDW0359791.1 DEAD/DEAH box helicase [Halomonas venusta]
MSMKELPVWLVSNEGFNRKLMILTLESVADQFDDLQRCVDFEYLPESDLSYMITCASLLAHSDYGRCQDAALRIAQYLLSNKLADSRKDSAALVLDALTNRAAIGLAEKRGLISPDYRDRLPFFALCESVKREISTTVKLSELSEVVFNKFQKNVWDIASESKWVSLSAPTSVGKSFFLESWVQNKIASKVVNVVIYLVPTRALITQVESDLDEKLNPGSNKVANVSSLPLISSLSDSIPNVFVFTQERLQIFLNAFDCSPKIDLLIVDEAHKIGDGYRGVFLQHAIETVSEQNTNVEVVFASPFTSNPEILLQDAADAKAKAIQSSDVTVNQNLIWVNQVNRKPKEWEVSLCLPDQIKPLGNIFLKGSPYPVSKRITFVAVALAQGNPGNLVYVNGAADAEKAAEQIYDCLIDQDLCPDLSNDEEIKNLIDLCEKTIHGKFLLNKTLKRGVAFHYGNIPLLVRTEIERLFSENKIRYLVCTSTLIEGVNMSCKNIFVRGPKKGSDRPMSSEDFWNLAGRAGRWGKEFQGNVICIDTSMEKLWENDSPPRHKNNIFIKRTTDLIFEKKDSLKDFIENGAHHLANNNSKNFEYVFSYLAISFFKYDGLVNSPFLKKMPQQLVRELDWVVGESLSEISFPSTIIYRNPGISPLSMELLYRKFLKSGGDNPERFLMSDPSSNDALDTFVASFTRIGKNLSVNFSFNSRQAYVRALLVVNWMRGFSLSRLISDRISYQIKKGEAKKISTTIRDVMRDVEEIARYQAPKFISCYNDVLSYYYSTINREDLAKEVCDFSVFLELGLSQKTQISLVGLGLSRTAAVLVSEKISNDSFSESEALNWLVHFEQKYSDFPELVKDEIVKAIFNARAKNEFIE